MAFLVVSQAIFTQTNNGMRRQQHAGPEQIDKTVGFGVGAGQLFDRVPKGGDALVGNAKDLEKINPERLALAVFTGSVSPGATEGKGAGFDFVSG